MREGLREELTNYPLSVILAAVRSSAGSLITLLGALSLATWVGLMVVDGEWLFPTDAVTWLILIFAFVGPICVACLQFWGFLQVGLIIWLSYMLVYQDAPRLRTSLVIVLPQFLCTVIVVGALEGFYMEMVLRIAIATPLVALFTVAPFVVDWARKRHQPIHALIAEKRD